MLARNRRLTVVPGVSHTPRMPVEFPVLFLWQIGGSETVRNINAVEARMQAQFTAALWVFFEPDEK